MHSDDRTSEENTFIDEHGYLALALLEHFSHCSRPDALRHAIHIMEHCFIGSTGALSYDLRELFFTISVQSRDILLLSDTSVDPPGFYVFGR